MDITKVEVLPNWGLVEFRPSSEGSLFVARIRTHYYVGQLAVISRIKEEDAAAIRDGDTERVRRYLQPMLDVGTPTGTYLAHDCELYILPSGVNSALEETPTLRELDPAPFVTQQLLV